MSDSGSPAPVDFDRVIDDIRAALTRPELVVSEIPAPVGLAPDAVALTADVRPRDHGVDSVLGTGRIVVLHDEAEPDAWGGAFRVIAYAQAPLETDIGLDPFVADVAWSWLTDALESRGARFTAASGTATKAISTGYGELAAQGDGAELELRASWTPLDDRLAAHVEAWSELLCLLAGLPPAGDGVAVLSARRAAHG